jgi:hypothetical protein
MNLAFLVQPPQSGEDEWSLILICDNECQNGSAVIQFGPKAKVPTVLRKTAEANAGELHPLLLLYQFLETHHQTTTKQLYEVAGEIEYVEQAILGELKYEATSQPVSQAASKAGWHLPWTKLHNNVSSAPGQAKREAIDRCNYGLLSQKLHQSRMNLVGIDRRNKFETQVCKVLRQRLLDEKHHGQRIKRTVDAISRDERVVADLPERISSQTSVVCLMPLPFPRPKT